MYGIRLMLEAGHEIDDHVPLRHFLALYLGPPVENH